MIRPTGFVQPLQRRSSGFIRGLLVLPALAWPAAATAQTLGPADGHDLPPTDIERVAVGDEAPRFVLDSFDRGPVSLADYRGEKHVVLVFYRGHW